MFAKRFRNILDDPLNLIYICIALTVGMFFGVLGFAIAFGASLIFYVVFVLRKYAFPKDTDFQGSLILSLEFSGLKEKEIESILLKYCKSFEIENFDGPSNSYYAMKENVNKNEKGFLDSIYKQKKIDYRLWMHDSSQTSELMKEIYDIDNLYTGQIHFNKSQLELFQ